LSSEIISLGEDLVVEFDLVVKEKYYSPLIVSIDINNTECIGMAIANNYDDNLDIGYLNVGQSYHGKCVFKNVNLSPGEYMVSLYVGTSNNTFDYITYCMRFHVEQGVLFIARPTEYNKNFQSVFQSEWEISNK
jgi:hypothetical protein